MKLLCLVVIGFLIQSAVAQVPGSLSGKVIDKETVNVLPYATIQLAGTSIGTTTNETGEFVFRMPATTQSSVVIVSYLGYQSVRINGRDRSPDRLTIALEPLPVSLNEVTVRPTAPWLLDDYEGIPRGSTGASINDQPIADIVGQLRASIPADGYNPTYKAFRLQAEFSQLFDRYRQRADTFVVAIKPPNSPVRTLRLAGRSPTPRALLSQQATARVIDSLHSLVLTIPSFATGENYPLFCSKPFGALRPGALKTWSLTCATIPVAGMNTGLCCMPT